MTRSSFAGLMAGLLLAGLPAAILPIKAAMADGSVRVVNAWTRATVPGQKVAGVYFDITSPMDGKLVGASSTIARTGEIHTMKIENGVMKMRRVASVDLPAGQIVKLEPGGIHVMLFDLERRLKPGEKIPLLLTIEMSNKVRREVTADMVVLNTEEAAKGHEHH